MVPRRGVWRKASREEAGGGGAPAARSPARAVASALDGLPLANAGGETAQSSRGEGIPRRG